MATPSSAECRNGAVYNILSFVARTLQHRIEQSTDYLKKSLKAYLRTVR